MQAFRPLPVLKMRLEECFYREEWREDQLNLLACQKKEKKVDPYRPSYGEDLEFKPLEDLADHSAAPTILYQVLDSTELHIQPRPNQARLPHRHLTKVKGVAWSCSLEPHELTGERRVVLRRGNFSFAHHLDLILHDPAEITPISGQPPTFLCFSMSSSAFADLLSLSDEIRELLGASVDWGHFNYSYGKSLQESVENETFMRKASFFRYSDLCFVDQVSATLSQVEGLADLQRFAKRPGELALPALASVPEEGLFFALRRVFIAD